MARSNIKTRAAGLHLLKLALIAVLLSAMPLPGKAGNSVKVVFWNSREYVSLYDFINTTNIDNSFDIITQRGKLYRKAAIAVYQVGFPVALVNGKVARADYPVARNKGEVLMPLPLFFPLARSLYHDMQVVRTGNTISIGAEQQEKEQEIAQQERPPSTGTEERISFIIIDPGHGGRDPGAIGHGSREKDITLWIARYLARELKEKAGNVRIKFTRSNDRFVELSRRTEIANGMLTGSGNGIFISIHANASLSPKISGYETYFLSPNPTNEEARTTATIENNVIVMENTASKKKYDDVEYLEALMLTTQIQRESSTLAGEIQKSLAREVKEFKSRGVKKADFYVLRGALMPAVLVEVGYISNSKESRYLKKDAYRRKLARGIARGVIGFITRYNDGIHDLSKP